MAINKQRTASAIGLRVETGPSMRLLASYTYKGKHTLPDDHPDRDWMAGYRTVLVCSRAIKQLAGWAPRRMHLEFQIGEVWTPSVRAPRPKGWWYIPVISTWSEPILCHTSIRRYHIYSGFHTYLREDLKIATNQLFKIVMVVEEV